MQTNEPYSVGDMWRAVRRDYLAGVTAVICCQKYNVSMSSFRLHARKGKWRRMDQPDCGVAPEPEEYHSGDACSFEDLARQTFLNIRRAVGTGRAADAGRWMRLYEKFADRARAEVLADLPDRAPPREPEAPAEPPVLYLTVDEDPVATDTDGRPLDSGPTESTAAETRAPPEPEPDPEPSAPDTVDSVFPERTSQDIADASGSPPADMDSVDSVSSECAPAGVSNAEPPHGEEAAPFDRDRTLLLRRRYMHNGLGYGGLDALLIANGVDPMSEDFFDPDRV